MLHVLLSPSLSSALLRHFASMPCPPSWHPPFLGDSERQQTSSSPWGMPGVGSFHIMSVLGLGVWQSFPMTEHSLHLSCAKPAKPRALGQAGNKGKVTNNTSAAAVQGWRF